MSKVKKLKSLFDICLEIDFDKCFNDSLDEKINKLLYEFHETLIANNYYEDSNYCSILKKISNFIFIKDMILVENDSSIDFDLFISSNEWMINDIQQKKILYKFNWLLNWYNFTKFNFNSKHEIDFEIIKYIRKEVNLGKDTKTIWDIDYLDDINDLILFLNSELFNDFPLIKSAIIFKRLIDIIPILSIDSIMIFTMFVLRKYNLDIMNFVNLYTSFLFFKNHAKLDKIIKIYQKMDINDFILIFKNTYLNSVEMINFIAKELSYCYWQLNSLNPAEIDHIYGEEFVEMFKSTFEINNRNLYKNAIYYNSRIFKDKIKELIDKEFIKDLSTKYSYFYMNNFVYHTISKSLEYLDNIYKDIVQ